MMTASLYRYNYGDSYTDAELVVNFEKSGISMPFTAPFLRGGYMAISDTEFLVGKQTDGLYLLTSDPYKMVGDKEIITIAQLEVNVLLDRAVNEFNRTNPNIRIEKSDYTIYGDVASAQIQLDLDLLQGNAPDIIYTFNESPDKYASRGALADLTELLANDPTLSHEDLFENILTACETDGKLYHMVTDFAVYSLVGKTSIFGERSDLTMAQLLDIAARYPSAELIGGYTASDWVTLYTIYMLDDLIDWNTGTCHFTSEEYLAVLNADKRLPSELDRKVGYDNITEFTEHFNDYAPRVRDDKVLLHYSLISDYRIGHTMGELYGEPVTYLGVPALTSSGNVIMPQSGFAITESSQNKEAAWQFISMLLQEDVGEDLVLFLSPNKNRFEHLAFEEMIPLADRKFTSLLLRQSTGISWYYESVGQEDVRAPGYENYHLTTDEIAVVRNAITGATRVAVIDNAIIGLLREELDAYCNGTRSAEETARIIQSRVSLYVAENS